MTSQYDQGAAGTGAMQARAVRELAAAATTLTVEHDVVGVTTSLLAGCTRAVGAAAGGLVLARPDDEKLELLASTSHRAHELELYQLQIDDGPCVEAVRTGQQVAATGVDEIGARWPKLLDAFEAAGFAAARAYPLLWHDHALGALNLFFSAGPDTDGIGEVGQAFADIATVAIIHSGRLSAQDVVARIRAALDERVVIERAKGVLVQTSNVTMEEAFDHLLKLSRTNGTPLGQIASQLIDNAGTQD
ncbi:GAF and ANTAR domain-containing protein [Kribbella qitaiheensis]|uniref:GAF and ANTAR domain-containing protein n=1 Tax=Kribbella qitaiheensis TaxID=1544730 RepID=A0A7G6WRG5_9ACTN|nr:ANTAR domain-containing protein [Kribbella qitaiheensis]QNE16580.1 GAF and ANTAR domain-containing protein [Kribbella qitaiheensis]